MKLFVMALLYGLVQGLIFTINYLYGSHLGRPLVLMQ
jgi:hypothetical protein